jgi:CHAD domain-containing protein
LSFSLDPAVPMSEAVRRVACAQLDSASAGIASPPDRHRGVHDARKCLKRLRSLLVLIEPGLPEPVYLSLTERLRTIAKSLAPARDAQALLDAIAKLGKDPTGDDDGTAIRGLTAWLQQQRRAAEQSLEGNMAADAMRGLFGLRPAMANLAVYPDAFRPVAQGLRDSYRAGRSAFKHAFATRDDEAFHDWRKTLQRHWRHMQLLAPCWPSELSARAELSRNLSQILGDDHDLAQLVKLVSAPTMVFASPEDTAAFVKRCRKRQKALRREAQSRGARLFVERPKPFVERIEAYWSAAAQGAKRTAPKPIVSNVVAFGTTGTAGRARASG